MTALTIPNADFVSGNTIASSEIDANFSAISTYANTTGVHVYQASTVTSTALGTTAISQYRDVAVQTSLRTAIASTANFAAPMGVLATLLSAAASSAAIIYIDPADYALTSKTTYARLVSWSQTETAPTSSTLTVALYPVSSTAAGVITVGTIVTGSTSTTAAITGANTRTLSTTADFAFPAAGYYVVVFAHSVSPAQTLTYGWKLQARAQ